MSKTPSIFSVCIRYCLSVSSLFWVVGITLFYLIATALLSNWRFVLATLIGTFPLFYKITILYLLSIGLFTALSPFDVALTISSAILVGINLVLLFKTIFILEHQGKVSLSIGGATIISLVSSGCASCGLSLLSLLGLSSSLSFLPLHGIGLHVLSIALLLFSSWYMLKKLRDGLFCKKN